MNEIRFRRKKKIVLIKHIKAICHGTGETRKWGHVKRGKNRKNEDGNIFFRNEPRGFREKGNFREGNMKVERK